MEIYVHPSQDLTQILKDHREAGTVFRLLPGVHESSGSWAFPDWRVLASGCTLRGAGRGATLLRLSSRATREWEGKPQGDRSLNPFWVGKGCTIEDLDIDGAEAQFRHADPAQRWYVASGIRSFGGQLTVRNVGIRGLRGDAAPIGTAAIQIEAFGISTTDDTSGGNVIEDVEFFGIPARSYFSAVYIGTSVGPAGEVPARSYVRRVRSHVGDGNWFGLSGGVNTEFEDVNLSGHQIAIYNDTGEMRDVLVRRLVANQVDKALSMVAKGAFPQTNVTVEDSEFTYPTTGSPKYAAELWDKTGSTVLGDVVFRRCRFGPADVVGLYLYSCAATKLREVRFEDCTLPENLRKSLGPGTPSNRVVVRGAMSAAGSAFSPKIA